MDRLLLTYHPAAAFWAGRLADRLSFRLGDEALSVVHPASYGDIDDLTAAVEEHDALLVVSALPTVDTEPGPAAHVHLATSLAIRHGTPLLLVEVGEGRGADESMRYDDDHDVVRVHVDPDRLDADTERLVDTIGDWASGVAVIPRVSLGETTVPAFVGLTESLPGASGTTPILISNWGDFEANFGGFTTDALLPHAVYGWFANGGGRCWIASIRPGEPPFDESITEIDQQTYVGHETQPSGIAGLRRNDDVTVLVLPDLLTVCRCDDGAIDLAMWKAIQVAAIQDAEDHGRLVILDPPPEMTPTQVRDWRLDAEYDSPAACLHYPWLVGFDPIDGTNMLLPPSGHLAGVWARNDRDRGVWRSPANRPIAGAVDIARDLTATERYILAPIGINPIRTLGRDGICVWGSKTLSSDPTLDGLEAARFLAAVRRACSDGLRWATFERPTASVQSAVRRQLEKFLLDLWKQGALVGERRSEAFAVECGTDDAGDLDVLVGLAVAEPDFFTMLRFGHRWGEQGATGG